MVSPKDDATSAAVQRLLEAWRDEVEAGAVYELIAQREGDPRRREILRRMAAAEAGHRGRLEERMRALGVAVPDPRGRPALAVAPAAGADRPGGPAAGRTR